jgi:hypothetical protein
MDDVGKSSGNNFNCGGDGGDFRICISKHRIRRLGITESVTCVLGLSSSDPHADPQMSPANICPGTPRASPLSQVLRISPEPHGPPLTHVSHLVSTRDHGGGPAMGDVRWCINILLCLYKKHVENGLSLLSSTFSPTQHV